LIWDAVLACVILLLIVIHCPNVPPSPPTLSSTLPPESMKLSFQRLIYHKSFWIICICGGLTAGVFDGFQSVFALLLPSGPPFDFRANVYPDNFSEFIHSEPWLGFIMSFGGIVGGLLIGPIAARIGHFKYIIISLFASSAVLFLWFALQISDLITSSVETVFFVCIVASFLLNAVVPLFYELTVEVSYPTPPGISGGIFCLATNLTALIFLVLGFSGVLKKNADLLNWVLPGVIAISAIAMCFFKEEYLRTNFDKKVTNTPTEEEGVELKLLQTQSHNEDFKTFENR